MRDNFDIDGIRQILVCVILLNHSVYPRILYLCLKFFDIMERITWMKTKNEILQDQFTSNLWMNFNFDFLILMFVYGMLAV